MNNIYYVYFHRNPYTEEIVYIGKGCHGRAWDVTRCRNQHKEHQDWMKHLCLSGYLPSDWVEIVEKELTEEEANKAEKRYIHNIGPKFNRQGGETNNKAKLTNEQAIEIYELANQKKSNPKQPLHQELADKYGVSRACISMIAAVKQWKSVLIPYLKGKNEVRT
jgi:hypothetical protein